MNSSFAYHSPAAEPPFSTPLCPQCGRPMRLARSAPRLAGLPELRTYECRPCGVSFTQAMEQGPDDEVA